MRSWSQTASSGGRSRMVGAFHLPTLAPYPGPSRTYKTQGSASAEGQEGASLLSCPLPFGLFSPGVGSVLGEKQPRFCFCLCVCTQNFIFLIGIFHWMS